MSAIGDHEWRVHFDGWGSNWDTTVGPSRIRHISAATVAARSQSTSMIVAAALLVVVVGGVGVFALLGSSASSSGGATSRLETGPGDANATYNAGQAVDLYHAGTWYPAHVREVTGDTYLVSYDGWSAAFDERVNATMLRPRAATADGGGAASAGPGDPGAKYTKGQLVDIHWGSSWWPGRVVEVIGSSYRVTYDGWAKSFDETVDARRLRKRTSKKK